MKIKPWLSTILYLLKECANSQAIDHKKRHDGNISILWITKSNGSSWYLAVFMDLVSGYIHGPRDIYIDLVWGYIQVTRNVLDCVDLHWHLWVGLSFVSCVTLWDWEPFPLFLTMSQKTCWSFSGSMVCLRYSWMCFSLERHINFVPSWVWYHNSYRQSSHYHTLQRFWYKFSAL